MSNPLPAIKQDFFDDNRKRFEAETIAVDIKDLIKNKCDHFFVRKSFTQVDCRKCGLGYYDNSRLIIKNGKLTGVK